MTKSHGFQTVLIDLIMINLYYRIFKKNRVTYNEGVQS